MKLKHVVAAVAVLALAGASSAAPQAAAPTPARSALDRFKALAGDWVSAQDGPMTKKGDLVARYTVTAAGSAVVETLFPGAQHEMVTVYHADGPDLLLTHYCMEGNQPRMRAKNPAARRVEFAFDGGFNINPRRDRHMHSAWVEFVSADEIRSQWTEHAQGKPAMVVEMDLLRKAQ